MRHRFTTPTAGTAECDKCGREIDPIEEGGHLCTPCAEEWEREQEEAEEEELGTLFVCPVCKESFYAEVWHCAVCAHHWQMHVDECPNCHESTQADAIERIRQKD